MLNYIMLAFAVMLAVLGVIQLVKIVQAHTKGVKTEGEVTEVLTEKKRSLVARPTVYRPVVRFEVGDKVYSQASPRAYEDERYPVGKKVELAYNPGTPEQFYLKNDFGVFFIPVVQIAVATAMALWVLFRYILM